MYFNAEIAQYAGDNVKGGIAAILNELSSRVRDMLGDLTPQEIVRSGILGQSNEGTALNELLTRWADANPKPLVLLIDEIDALVGDTLIADFCRTQEPPLWQPPTPQKRALQEMSRRLDALIEQRTRETNRLKSGRLCEAVQESLQESLAFLDGQVAKLEAQINDHIDQHPDLRQEARLLTSIPGVGDKTAAKLLAELPAVERFAHVGQAVAYAGLSPQEHTSGSSVRKKSHLTKIGKRSIKTAMYFPALIALRHNPIIQALVERLEKHGKEKMVIVGAAMRKLFQLAYGVLKSGKPFDPNYANLSQGTA